ncbi:accessory gene regulator B family protein [Enterococcus sp. LJL99]
MENRVSIEEQFSLKLTNCLKQKIALTEIEEAKISYGLSVLLITLVKLFLIYITSLMLGTFFVTLICHIPFCIVRNYSKGFHAKSSFNCGVSGIICFSILPWLLHSLELTINPLQVITIGIISVIVLFFRAPADTEKDRIQDLKQRSKLRKRAVLTYIFLCMFLFILFKDTHQVIGIGGLTIAVILTFPREKIFWRNQK